MKILFIRRDNIGDLICTTPAIHAVREKYPDAKIGILVNSYNADVVANNPDIDEIYVYKKAKHTPDKNSLSVWLDGFRFLRNIRKEKYDVTVACGSFSPTLARYAFFTGAKLRIGYNRDSEPNFFYNKPLVLSVGVKHEVESVFDLVAPLGISGKPGKLIVVPDDTELRKCDDYMKNAGRDPGKPVLAIAISARIAANKWPTDNFMALIDKILLGGRLQVLLIWAPGSENSATFPGDEESSERIRRNFDGRIMAYPTPSLKSLIAALAHSDIVVTPDTGSLHMAAALDKPTVALMTRGKSLTWYPWKTRNIVLIGERAIDEIQVDDVLKAVNEIVERS